MKVRIILAVILCLAAGARFVMMARMPKPITGDGIFYHVLAKNILHGRYQITDDSAFNGNPTYRMKDVEGKFLFSTVIKDQPTNYWSPGYPVFIASIYAVFGERPRIVSFLGCLMGTASCWLMFQIGNRLHSPATGLISAGLLAIHPYAIFSSSRLESETPALLLFLLLTYLLLKWRASGKGLTLPGILLLGLLSGVLFYVRSTYILAIAVTAGTMLFPWRRGRGIAALIYLSVFLAIIIPWGFRNQRALGEFMLFETRGVNVLYGEMVSKLHLPIHFRELQGVTELERWKEQKAAVIEILASDPGALLKMVRWHLGWVFLPLSQRSIWLIWLDLLVWAGFVYGVILLHPKWPEVMPLLAFIMLYALTVLLLMKGNEPRFRLPVEAVVIIIVSAALTDLAGRLKSKPKTFIRR